MQVFFILLSPDIVLSPDNYEQRFAKLGCVVLLYYNVTIRRSKNYVSEHRYRAVAF